MEIDSKIDARLKEFHEIMKGKIETVKNEIHSELHSLFEQYLGAHSSTPVIVTPIEKGKGILGSTPPRIVMREPLAVPPLANWSSTGTSSRVNLMDTLGKPYRLECPHFDGTDFRG